jgi:putative FmdB family regulatory protein
MEYALHGPFFVTISPTPRPRDEPFRCGRIQIMPTYDYECDACGHTMELFQGINDPIKKKCPDCGKNKLKRLFGTGAAIVFKGSGFYQTDYRSEGYKKAAAADSKSNSSDKGDSKGSDGGKKSETKKTDVKKTEAKKPSSDGGGATKKTGGD